ncbi:MAG: hypothetical protein U9N53_03695 [Bacteroidota bacterium]|nr:hypothetical protein [Bacteroidota bacterium]
MKKKFIIIATIALLLSPVVNAQDSGFGAGVMFGTQTGLSLKMWTGETTAVAAGMSWSVLDQGYFNIHADMLIHRFNLIPVNEGKLPLYFGLGLKLGFGNDVHIGIRVPIGLNYMFDDVPIDIFVEVAPGLQLTPATAFDIDGGLGARYYF